MAKRNGPQQPEDVNVNVTQTGPDEYELQAAKSEETWWARQRSYHPDRDAAVPHWYVQGQPWHVWRGRRDPDVTLPAPERSFATLQQVRRYVAEPAEAHAPQWHDRPGREAVAAERWGRDHWSVLAYVETREVDFRGQLDWNAMTVSARNWPTLFNARTGHARNAHGGDAADIYGVHLKSKDGAPVVLAGHCEVDALMDLVDAGLVVIEMPPASSHRAHFQDPRGRPLTYRNGIDMPRPDSLTGMGEQLLMPYARFRLTEAGRDVAGELRAHKARDGRTWSSFSPGALPG